MNWDEPANTQSDMARAPAADSPLGPARVPKITPNGAAPSSIGSESRAPLQASVHGWGKWSWDMNDSINNHTPAWTFPDSGRGIRNRETPP